MRNPEKSKTVERFLNLLKEKYNVRDENLLIFLELSYRTMTNRIFNNNKSKIQKQEIKNLTKKVTHQKREIRKLINKIGKNC
jgi:hypothetical protein